MCIRSRMFETKGDIYIYNYQFPSVTLATGSQFLFTIFASLLCLRVLDSSALSVFLFFFLPVTTLCHLLPPTCNICKLVNIGIVPTDWQ